MGANSSSHRVTRSHSRNEEPDAPDSLIPPSRLRAQATARHKYLLSLDRSMKVFLRASNLPGLEYRLRLAGYHTFHDLLSTDRQTLESKGFTGLMATRLLRAISAYLLRQLSRSEEERLPFRLVRRGQRIQTDPSESMRENPNFRKRNFKRQKSSGEDGTRKGPGGSWSQIPSQVRLMRESDLELQHLISPPPALATAGENEGGSSEESTSVEATARMETETAGCIPANGGNGDGSLPPQDDRGQRIIGVIVKDDAALLVVEDGSSSGGEDPQISELDDALLREEALLSLNQLRQPPAGTTGSRELDIEGVEETDSGATSNALLPRRFSVPADLKLTPQNPEEFVFTPIRSFSCTVSPLSHQQSAY